MKTDLVDRLWSVLRETSAPASRRCWSISRSSRTWSWSLSQWPSGATLEVGFKYESWWKKLSHQQLKGHNLLGKLYEDPKRWSFQFQSYVQLTRLQLLKKPTSCSVKIIERSIQNNRFCFLENARREGSLSGSELEVWKTLSFPLVPLMLCSYFEN